MKERNITYHGCLIRDDGDGYYTAYYHDCDGDPNELTTKSLDKAKAAIDSHLFDCNGNPYEPDDTEAEEESVPEAVPTAKLVTFTITTRVIINASGNRDDDKEMAYCEACGKILPEARHYFCWDNLDRVVDDEECPYDPKYDKVE